MKVPTTSFVLLLCSGSALAAPQVEQRAAAPTVTGSAPSATYIGSSAAGIDSFKGIPFAVPPVGKNRLYAPSSISTALGTVKATGMAMACPQFYLSPDTSVLPEAVAAQVLDSPFLQIAQDTNEDCLNLNIQRPSGTNSTSKLPVVFWIYGGGFEFGSTQAYDGTFIISQSVASKEPVMYVAINYRVAGFGFLPGSEIKKAGAANLGLLDQRLALQWVADNIERFGGDPSRVTIWGESAGSISVFDQMILYNGDNTYKGKPLFHGAIMDSGSIVPANPVDGFKGQAVYDAVVRYAGCTSSSDTLECLRSLPYESYLNASNSVPAIFSYNSVAESYLPRPDGVALVQSPELALLATNYTKIPFIIGDQEDEGTLFSLVQDNLTTTADVVQYLHTLFFPDAPISRIQGLVDTYPNNAAAGAPFQTGPLYEIYPQYKRLAALLGDITFTLVRRVTLDAVSQLTPSIPTWSYLSSYLHETPILGTFHATDIPVVYGYAPLTPPTIAVMNYYISFFNYLTPNKPADKSLPVWPKWAKNQELLNFQDTSNPLLKDTFRNETFTFLTNRTNVLRI